jgi:ankyrin repeat protein
MLSQLRRNIQLGTFRSVLTPILRASCFSGLTDFKVVLRVYKSIGEILTGFDLDSAGGAFSGSQVWVAPRALGSYITQCNQIDLSRRSPSYENRLSKYSHRNFEVYWPELDRSRIDPTIFERSFQRTLGLARLLVLERLPTTSSRETYMRKRREERGRPAVNRTFFRGMFGNIKDEHEDEVADWVNEEEVSNYHTFTVPYGPKFNAKKIEKLLYTKDLLLNAEWNQPKDGPRQVYLHRHPAFFGRVKDVIEDCCGTCPKPVTPEEKEVAEKEAEIYISGKISFLIDNPGRQQIGSFNPLTDDDWTDMAYIGNTERLCHSIIAGDLEEVNAWLSQEGADPNKRDYTGRSALHLAVMSSTPQIVRTLVEHGVRITARLADGRTALHLAAERGEAAMVKILMEKSIENEEKYEEEQARLKAAKFGDHADGAKPSRRAADAEAAVDSDADDSDPEVLEQPDTETDGVSMATGSFVMVKDEEEKETDNAAPEESPDDPDYYQIDVLSWDTPASPLHYAIVAGHEEVVNTLAEFGADALLPVKFLDSEREPTNAILTLCLALQLPLEQAKSMAKLLLKLGASSSQADLNSCTVFHRYVDDDRPSLVDTLWDLDKTGVKAALNHLLIKSNYWSADVVSPLQTAIGNNDSILCLRLLEAGASPTIDFESWLKAARLSKKLEGRLTSFEENKKFYGRSVTQPLIIALQHCPDPEVAKALLEGGADPNAMTARSAQVLADEWQRRSNRGETALDVIRDQLKQLRKYTGEHFNEQPPELIDGIDEFVKQHEQGTYQRWIIEDDVKKRRKSHDHALQNYEKSRKRFEELKGVNEKKQAVAELVAELEKLEELIIAKGGLPFYELHPDIKPPENHHSYHQSNKADEDKKPTYSFKFSFKHTSNITEARQQAYLELFEAAWVGNLGMIEQLTTHSWDAAGKEAPLQIAVQDQSENSPLSLAFLRGHKAVAKAILDIAQAQYAPPETEAQHFSMRKLRREEDDEDEEYDEEEEDDDDSSDINLVSKTVDKKFTIDNVGEVSMLVQSRISPLDFLQWHSPTFKFVDGEMSEVRMNTRTTLFHYVIDKDDVASLGMLLRWANGLAVTKLKGDDGSEDDREGFFTFPESEFQWAIMQGKIQIVAEIIKQTGAGIPLDHLVKKSGLKVKEKPRYYQGLSVYGKKRKDWANAGRNLVVKTTGTKIPPLLHAAAAGSIESVEWFMGDTPHRFYLEFGRSKAAQADTRLKHLNQASGGFDRAVSRWLGIQNEYVLHCAVTAKPSEQTDNLVRYLIKSVPAALDTRNSQGDTPLMLATWLGRESFMKILIEAGADQSVRSLSGQNLLHYALEGNPLASQLKRFLAMLDKELLPHLFVGRCRLSDDGVTPLHQFVGSVTQRGYYYGSNPRYAHSYQWEDVLAVLLEASSGAELEMLNGAGDTPLHTAVMNKSISMVERLARYRPKLIFRENAVGRTPFEIAKDKVTAEHFKQPDLISSPSSGGQSFSALASKPTEWFLDHPTLEGRRNKGRDFEGHASEAEQILNILLETAAKAPNEKRRLVSLNEANDVARRLGEKYTASRYFSIRARGEEDDDKEDKDEDDSPQDFSYTSKNAMAGQRWICAKHGRRHDRGEEDICE